MNIKKIILITSLTVFCCISFAKEGSVDKSQRAVLVTGASSGSGRVIAETLAANGYFVYAGARKDIDLRELSAIDNIQGIRLDVTIQSDVDAAVETVAKAGRGLYGLVNNAGVTIMGPLIEFKMKDMEFLFDVNVYGPFRVTKAFAPLLIESKGRISMTGSISGILSDSFFGPYSMSKHAMEAFNDSLAIELEKFGIKVSIIEPGGFNSKLGEKANKRITKDGFSYDKSLYKKEWEKSWVLQNGGDFQVKNSVPERIANAVLDNLESDNPKARYLIVGKENTAHSTIRKAMKEMVQLNHKQPHMMDRETLVKMLDELLLENKE